MVVIMAQPAAHIIRAFNANLGDITHTQKNKDTGGNFQQSYRLKF